MRKRTIGIVAVVLLLAVGIVWAVGSREDAAVQKVRQLREEVFSGDGPPNREKMDEFRQAVQGLSEQQRNKLREEMHGNFERQMDRRISGYFTLPPTQRKAYLDKQIQEMEKMRKEMETRRARAAQSGQGQNRPRPPQAQAGAGGGNQPGPNAGGQGRGGGRNRSPEARATRRNARLDRSTPEQRAQRTAYFDDLRKRRIELGLPAYPQRGPRPGGR